MQAYKNAPTRNLRTQILSLYAYRYPMKKLQKLHEPYESITTWQINIYIYIYIYIYIL